MKKEIFFLAIMILFFGVVSSQETVCSNGEINSSSQKYCDSGVWVSLKSEGISCLNDYECVDGSCVDGLCQGKYSSFDERGSILDRIYLFFGREFDFGDDDDDDEDNPNNPTRGNGRSDRIILVMTSPIEGITYSSSLVRLEVYDSNRNARYWWYSLNGGEKISFTPNATINVREGSNNLVVYGRKSVSSTEYSESLVFSYNKFVSSYSCGNNFCDSGESCSSCSSDCGSCPLPEEEPIDEEEIKKRGAVIFWMVFIIFIILVIVLSFVIWSVYQKRKANENKKLNESKKPEVKQGNNSVNVGRPVFKK